jgi:hypothetical protein
MIRDRGTKKSRIICAATVYIITFELYRVVIAIFDFKDKYGTDSGTSSLEVEYIK